MEWIWTMGLTALWCAGTALCYRQGLRDGSSLARRGEMGTSPRLTDLENQEQGRLRRLMGRIDRYDGREGER